MSGVRRIERACCGMLTTLSLCLTGGVDVVFFPAKSYADYRFLCACPQGLGQVTDGTGEDTASRTSS